MRIVPRRGYLLLFTGIFIGIMISYMIFISYSPKTVSGGGIPKYIEITFLYSSEKQGWLEEVTPIFEEKFYKSYGIEVKVNLLPAGTHESINLIIHGSVKPTIWSPASSIWIPYLNYLWEKEHGYKIASEWYPLVISPIVIAGWRSIIVKYNISGFKSLYYLAKNGVDFKWGHPDPQLSNGGTMTVLLEFSEIIGKPPDKITIDDLNNETVIEMVRLIESKAVAYGKSTGFFGRWAVDNGPDAISFFGVYENIVIDNSYRAYKKWNDRLVAVYPSFGTILSDHPFVLINASWVKPYQRLVALQYLSFLLQPEIQFRAQKHGFRPVNPVVTLNSTIFSQENGVVYKLNIPIFSPPSGEILDTLFKIWEKVRNPGAG